MRRVNVPPVLDEVLGRDDAAIVVSISGGKDSQAMLAAVAQAHHERGWKAAIFAIHADLGRAEWPQSLAHCQKQCDELGIFLKVVRRPQGDLVQEIQDRQAKLTGTGRSAWPTATQRYCTSDQKRGQIETAKRQPFWPDAKNRYCTSDQKRDQINTAVRAPHWPSATNRYCTSHQKSDQIDKDLRSYSLVVSAMGMRAQESKPRAKREPLTVDRRLTAKPFRDLGPECGYEAWEITRAGPRLALDWLPIHDWSIDEVWAACGTTAQDIDRRRELYAAGDVDGAFDGWQAHPAYVFGNARVSCAFCILATKSDLRVGATHNPGLYRTYVQMERESGFTFKNGQALADIAPELLTDPITTGQVGASNCNQAATGPKNDERHQNSGGVQVLTNQQDT